jgi:hypothetical protein
MEDVVSLTLGGSSIVLGFAETVSVEYGLFIQRYISLKILKGFFISV